MELSIDTSTRFASLALSIQGKTTAELAWKSEQNHSVEFVPALRQLMELVKVNIDNIEAIFVAKGPGRFSALRVGLSIAKSLAMAQSMPLVAINTLDVEAQPYLELGFPVCSVIEANRSNLYAAIYEADKVNMEVNYIVESKERLISIVPKKTLFCGEAAHTITDFLTQDMAKNGFSIMKTTFPTRRAGVMANLGYQRLQAMDTDDLEKLQPLYISGSQFEVANNSELKEG